MTSAGRTATNSEATGSATLTASMGTRQDSGGDECPFCLIAAGRTDTEVLLSDDELLCFCDVKPGVAHHYLVVTAMHIDSCKALRREHVALVERMVAMGRSVLEKNKVNMNDVSRMGFHLPPFTSVPHLHLHALSPASTMCVKSQLRYGPRSHWFITVISILLSGFSHPLVAK
uniref:HIT domain-containing protein n=1 Tax=Mola mola TaxID=94237 RepID=A0A3Q3WRK3_MOLML